MVQRRTRPRRQRGARGGRNLQPRKIVVFCVEGKSEREYLRALNDYRYNGAFVPVFWDSKPSLRNLVETARRRAKSEDSGEGIWIVCDTDQNSPHRPGLDEWLQTEGHHAVVTDPCLEYWLLLHYTGAPPCHTPHDAERELGKVLPGYSKGEPVPAALIGRTDQAVSHERSRRASLLPGGADGWAWPTQRGSQFPDLIQWLDELSGRSS